MNVVVTLTLRLLRLPTRRRLVLVLGTLVVSLGLYGLAFPTTYLGGVLMLPIILSAWLFGWGGGLLCVAGVTLMLGASYGLAFGGTFWSSAWFVPFVTGTLYGLAVSLTVGVLRRMTDALLGAQHIIARTEQVYRQEHAQNELKDQVLQNLSHELRTPLTQILGYLDLLETYQEQFDAATQARFIMSARSGCEELGRNFAGDCQVLLQRRADERQHVRPLIDEPLVCHLPKPPIAAGIGRRDRPLPVRHRVCRIRDILAVLLRSSTGPGRVE